MLKIYTTFCITVFSILYAQISYSQSGTEFWFAPPDITDLHNSPGGEPLFLVVSSTGLAANVTVSQPANPAFNGGAPITAAVAANQSVKINLTSLKASLETRPTNTILNTGLFIEASTSITCYYECANTNNTDIWALKGGNGLGTEFYVPMHKHAPFYNEPFSSPHPAFASFDICATENNTVVTIYSPVALDGHPALQQFSITLDQGQTYSAGYTGTNYQLPSNHPSGAVVLSDKPITVSIKDDSNHNPSGGCYDILGDQIVPVSVIGEDYIAVKGSLNNNGDESVVLMATQNNTQVFINGSATPAATLFAGEYYRVDMDYLAGSGTENAVYIHCTQPTYAMHITGFGCEMGMAQLPPLNCAGSQQLNFTRGSSETFYITLLCRASAINGFSVTGPTSAIINPASFVTVPGTGGEWRSARITYNTSEVPVDATFKVSNSIDVFALGVINGGSNTGCKYGYFSEFVAPINVNANINQTVCANTNVQLAGSVSGGTTTGEWTSTGTGSFSPSNSDLNAIYTPSAADAAAGNVTLTLTSTGACTPVSDDILITITPAPTVSAGSDISACSNNATISLSGTVTIASGGIWTGGAGTFIPNNTTLNAVYIPTSTEINSGSLALTLTTTGNGICNPISDNVLITFTPAPIVNAGVDQTKCANNALTQLNGSVSVATGAVWTGGLGSFSPSATTLNASYNPSPSEILNGSVTLTLTSTGNGNCNVVSDNITISFTAPPTVNAGQDQTVCANNASVALNGSVSVASGGTWSGGLGIFSPSNNSLGATYTPTIGEIANGSVTLTLTTTGNGSCSSENDQMTIFFTAAPTINAGPNQASCANNPSVVLNASYTVASGMVWSGGNGTFSTNNTDPNTTYTPSAAEIAIGSVTLVATTTGNGTCNQVSDEMSITILPSPIVNAGQDISACANNATISLSGQVFNATGGVWSGGAGAFMPNSATLNAIYTPTTTEIENGSITLSLTSTGNGNCISVSDNVTITFAPAPVVNAGVDQTVCGNNATVNLSGFVNFALGGQWSGGLGSFSPNTTSLITSYTPSNDEIANGFVNLTLTSSGNGSCVPVSDVLTINITSAPSINIIEGETPCTNNPVFNASVEYTVSSGIQWSANGSISPSSTATSIAYTPTLTEVENGQFEITATTTGNGNCLPVSQVASINLISAPLVNAGTNQTICVTSLDVSLSGSVSGSSNQGVWSSSGSGVFSPNNTSLNAVYTCSAADSLAGGVTLTLTSVSSNTCFPVQDEVTINILPAGIANAGLDAQVCGNNASVLLNGIISGGASSGVWSTNGTGVFSPNASALNATYVPSSSDIATGEVILTLTANSCNAAFDQITLSISPSRTISLGSDIILCADATEVNLEAIINNGPEELVWTTTGSGSISPSINDVSIVYQIGANDIANETISFTATTINNGSCLPVSDQILVQFFPTGTADAGLDQTVCSNNASVSLNGIIGGGASLGLWSTNGTGIFTPSSTQLDAVYTPSQQDIINGNVVLTLEATNSCNSALDNLEITFFQAPILDAGEDQSFCGENPSFQLNGFAESAPSISWVGGNGTFIPNNSTLDAIYIPSPTEQSFGSVSLTLTAPSNSGCNDVSDVVTLFISTGLDVNVGSDITLCNSAEFVQLSGLISNGSPQGIWSTNGTGTFSPSANNLNVEYSFSDADYESLELEFILTTTANGNCPINSDTLVVEFTDLATSFAGADIDVCSSNNIIDLSGTIGGGATASEWQTTGSGSFQNSADLITTYTLGSDDELLGNVYLVLAGISDAGCGIFYDTLLVNITPVSSVLAGGDITICNTENQVIIGGNISGASSEGFWVSSGSGTFSPDNVWTGNTTYNLSPSDLLQENIEIILFSENTGICAPSSDTLSIVVQTPTVVNAGSNISVCSNTEFVALNGLIASGIGGATWSSSGTGTFELATSNLINQYFPSAGDIASGSIDLILTSTQNGTCPISVDTLTLQLIPEITVNAGPDRIICGDKNTVEINGLITGASSGIWNTAGSGSFENAQTELLNTYTLSPSDIASGSVTLTLLSTGNGFCPNTSDDLLIVVEPLPVAAFTSESDDELGVAFTDESIGANSWEWVFENGATSAIQDPYITFPEAGQYGVTLYVYNVAGCVDSIISVVQALEKQVLPVAFPTGFSPNGDGNNEVLHVLGGPFKEVDFRIYNSWGNEIFHTTDPEGGWDGTYKGVDQPVGVYVYTVEGITIDDKKVKMSGNVTLIK